MSDSRLSRREVDKQYRPNGFGLSPGLQRARAPFRLRNALTGFIVGSFAVGVYWYSIRAVKQDNFDDVDEEAKALLSSRLEGEKAQAGPTSTSTSTSSTSAATTPAAAASVPTVAAMPPTSDAPSASPAIASGKIQSGEANANTRGLLARWVEERSPRALDPASKTFIWGAPPVDRLGRLGDASAKRT